MNQPRCIAPGSAHTEKSSFLRLLGATTVIGVAAYGAYVLTAWLRYGHARRIPAKSDPLLDSFMPEYEVVEHRSIRVNAPAEITLSAACDVDFEDSHALLEPSSRVANSCFVPDLAETSHLEGY